MSIRIAIRWAGAVLGLSPWLVGEVVSFPAPPAEYLSGDYTIEVDGKSVPVYAVQTQHHDHRYSAAYFDFRGEATVTIRTNLPLDHCAVLPARCGVTPLVRGREATFKLGKPCDLSFEPTGQDSPLLLFANPLEESAPRPNDPNVIYYGPGVHDVGLIRLKSNQTLYLAGGALVKGGVDATGDNIRICGRGILDGSDWEHNAGPNDFFINAVDCRNLVLQDVILKGSYYWTVVPIRCDGVLIDHIRICGSRVGNDDGIDPCNSSNVTIRNCFLRTDDDSISPKGITRAGGEATSRPTENIIVENCTFWVDFANAFRIAAESSCPSMRNFVARDIDIIHFPPRPGVQVIYLEPKGNMPMENLLFERIHINGETELNVARLAATTPLAGTRPRETPKPNQVTAGPGRRGAGGRGYGEFVLVPGEGARIRNVVIKDVDVYGTRPAAPAPPEPVGKPAGRRPDYAVALSGQDSQHDVESVLFQNVTVYGETLAKDSPMVHIGSFVSDVRFQPTGNAGK